MLHCSTFRLPVLQSAICSFDESRWHEMCTSGTKSVLLYVSHQHSTHYGTQQTVVIVDVALAEIGVDRLSLQFCLLVRSRERRHSSFHGRDLGHTSGVQKGSAAYRNEIVNGDSKPSVRIGKGNLRLEAEHGNTLFSAAIEGREKEKEERIPSVSWIGFSASNRVILFFEKKPMLFVTTAR